MEYRDEYLDECMVLEGRGKFTKGCAGCNKPFPSYCCRDCKLGPLWCKNCIVRRHDQSPLHCIEVCGQLSVFHCIINSCDTCCRCGIPYFSRRQCSVSLVFESSLAMHPVVHAQQKKPDTKISSSLILMESTKSTSTSADVTHYLGINNSFTSDGGHPPPSSLKLAQQWTFFTTLTFSTSRATFRHILSIALLSCRR